MRINVNWANYANQWGCDSKLGSHFIASEPSLRIRFWADEARLPMKRPVWRAGNLLMVEIASSSFVRLAMTL